MQDTFLHVLVSNPWIAATYTGGFLRPAVERLAQLAEGAAADLLVRPNWHGPALLPAYAEQARELATVAPNVRLTFAAATAEDDLLARRSGLSSIWCSHNALVDERIFAPAPGAETLYDAVYVGRFSPFKRHELAARVPRLAVVSSPHGAEDPYAGESVARFQDLRFTNYANGRITDLPPEEVRRVLNASRCGLALSAVEGAMYGSIEYLLSGLPVVTTPSVGGRDVFFHPDYVETVEPEPDAVAAGVARIVARNLDPEMIRSRTIDLIRPHRARLIMWLSGLAQHNLFPLANETLWLPSFSNKLETFRTG